MSLVPEPISSHFGHFVQLTIVFVYATPQPAAPLYYQRASNAISCLAVEHELRVEVEGCLRSEVACYLRRADRQTG